MTGSVFKVVAKVASFLSASPAFLMVIDISSIQFDRWVCFPCGRCSEVEPVANAGGHLIDAQ
jgi:hypothetical protein